MSDDRSASRDLLPPTPEDEFRPGLRLAVPVLAVAVLGCLLTGLLTWLQAVTIVDTAEETTDAVVQANATSTDEALQELYGAVQSVSGLFRAVGDVSERQFREFTQDILADHPELQALQYSEAITDSERAEFEQRLRRSGRGVGIQDPSTGGLVPSARRAEYVPIVFSEPVEGNEEVFGLDIIFRDNNRETVQVARDTGVAQVGGRTRIVQGGGDLDAIHIYEPLYEDGAHPETVAERRARLLGIAGAVVVYERLMQSTVTEHEAELADIALLDPDVEEGPPLVLWRSDGAEGVPIEELATWPSRADIPLPDRSLLLVGRPSESLWASLGPWRVWLTALIGLVITALLTALMIKWVDARRFRRLAEDLHAASGRLRYLAERDPLTGLPHRDGLRHWTDTWIEENPDARLALMFTDLDAFKDVNSAWGHPTGDVILRMVGERLASINDGDQFVARIGGDEFVIAAPIDENADPSDMVAATAARVQESLARPIPLGNRDLLLSASIGVAVFPDDGSDLETLLARADTAVRRAKQGPRGTVRRFTPDLAEQVVARQRLESDLRRAVRDPGREFRLVYQPQVELVTGRVVGAEALLRWDHPSGELRSPMEFIQVAEQSGLVQPLGAWVLDQACRQIQEWAEHGVILRLSVNVTAQQVADGEFPDILSAALDDHGVEPGRLELEVTESTAMAPEGAARLAAMQELGVTVAIDDFGTGFSSLSRLSEFPAQRLKIDRSFISGLATSQESLEIVRAIVALSRALTLDVIAEGVEAVDQAQILVGEGVETAQGSWFARPMGAADLADVARTGFSAVTSSAATAAPGPRWS